MKNYRISMICRGFEELNDFEQFDTLDECIKYKEYMKSCIWRAKRLMPLEKGVKLIAKIYINGTLWEVIQ